MIGRAILWPLAVAIAVLVLAPSRQVSAATTAEIEARYHALKSDLQNLRPPAQTTTSDAEPVAGLYRPIDLRVALFRVARPEMAEEFAVLTAAQGARGMTALALTHGVVDLQTLIATVQATKPEWIGPDGFRIPIVIEPGAKLRLRPGDVLALDRAYGAFVLGFGQFDSTGGAVIGTGAPNINAPAFRPFVLMSGTGTLVAQNSYFGALGFGWRPLFGGLAVVTNSLFGQATSVMLDDVTIRDAGSVTVSGAGSARITNSTFINARRSALILQRSHAARIKNTVFFGGGSGDAIRLLDGATDTIIDAVEIYDARENAIALAPGSHGTTIRDTLIWRPRHNGVRAEASECITLRGLTILGARFNGITLSGARGTEVSAGIVEGARQAGLRIAARPGDSVTTVRDIRFAHNRIGIETAAPGSVALLNNDFRDQFPRFLAGDVQPLTPHLLADLSNRTPLVLTAGGRVDTPPKRPACLSKLEH